MNINSASNAKKFLKYQNIKDVISNVFVERYMKYKTEFNILEFYIVCLFLTESLKDDTKIKCFRS